MECDGCTLCCKLLNIPWMDSPSGELCKECDEGKGCKIYNNAPKKCLEFNCAYNQMEKVNVALRPDKCGVIFERVKDIFVGTVNPKKDSFKDVSKRQIDLFLKDGFSVILFKKKTKPLIMNTVDHTPEYVWEIVHQEVKKLNGSP